MPLSSAYHRGRPPLELWGGVECTVNRVGDAFLDQFAFSGHLSRPDDLDRFAGLGLHTLRYPVSWERTTGFTGRLDHADWSWPDARLARLRELGIRPIVGLVHHGSGPLGTSLVDPAFPEKLAEFARSVAARYPWVTDYTPVSEPLTTARFSGLYGHWYPHGRDEQTFARALLIQCKAVVLAMRAVREVRPDARLVQTDDLGKTHSTPPLAYQAEFENERRWIAFDLLCGRVSGPHHRVWHHLKWAGVSEADIAWFAENPCPPDVLGINHYLTSERFLDERLERYPGVPVAGNGRDAYVDVEAVRVLADGPIGARGLLREAWERYRLPLAITEAHLGCTREEQMRWLVDVWRQCDALRREENVDVRAVTAWSLLGAYDWDSLLTRERGHYEPGVFDLRGPQPRPTALAGVVRELAAGRVPDHPVLAIPGWWRRPKRLLYEPVPAPGPCGGGEKKGAAGRAPMPWPTSAPREAAKKPVSNTPAPLLIVHSDTPLGDAFARICDERGLDYRLLSRRQMNVTDRAAVERTLDETRPWALVNTAEHGSVDAAEDEPYHCYAENVVGPATLALACRERGLPLLTFSSALVFDGTKDPHNPYVESDPTRPLSVYGHSKAEAEARVCRILPDAALIVRTSAVWGPWHADSFLARGLRALAAGLPVYEAGDYLVTPVYLPDLVHAGLDLLLDGERGVWHLAHPGPVLSRADLVRRTARLAGLDPAGVEDWPLARLHLRAPRPAHAVLGSERGVLLPALDGALAHFTESAAGLWSETRWAARMSPRRQPRPPHPQARRRNKEAIS